jgi:hypothetical protein
MTHLLVERAERTEASLPGKVRQQLSPMRPTGLLLPGNEPWADFGIERDPVQSLSALITSRDKIADDRWTFAAPPTERLNSGKSLLWLCII